MTTGPALKTVDDLLKEGFSALQGGRAAQAGDCCRRALALDPKRKEAHFLVGLVALELNDVKTAIGAFGSVTKLDPDHAAAFAQLARLFMRTGQPARAEKALAQVERIGAADPAVADLAGVAASLLGDQRLARDYYAKAVAAAPDRIDYKINLATALMFLGETAEAETLLRDMLAAGVENPQAEWLLSSIAQAQAPSRAKALMGKARAASDQNARAFLAYAAGKEFEDCNEWPAAFEAFAEGARAKRATISFDEDAEEAMFEALDRTFPADFARGRTGHQAQGPIFVIGQPRTGTTLVERIMTSHSQIQSAGELQQFSLSIRRLARTPIEGRWSANAVAASAEVDLEALGREYLRASAPMRGDALWFVDKLPANFIHTPLILAALPQAKIVHLTRAPMDACLASYKQLFADAYYHSYDQGEMARHYVRYRRLMDRWRTNYPGRFLDISYEETVEDVERAARRLIGFVGLNWEEACARFHESPAAVATASAVQVREKAHTRSVGRWRRYRDELAPMRHILGEAGFSAEIDG